MIENTCQEGETYNGTDCVAIIFVPNQAVESLSSTSKASAGITALITALSSFASGSSGQSIWAMINQYQLVLLLPILGTYLENNFRFYVSEFQVMAGFSVLDYVQLPVIDITMGSIDYEQPNKLFADNGYESGSFIYGQYGAIKVLLIISAIGAMFFSIKWLIKL